MPSRSAQFSPQVVNWHWGRTGRSDRSTPARSWPPPACAVPGQPDSPPIAADQAITPREALRAYTRVPAVIGGREADEGSVAVGKFATLTVFASDPLAVTPDQLAGIPIVGTLVRGKFEHRAY